MTERQKVIAARGHERPDLLRKDRTTSPAAPEMTENDLEALSTCFPDGAKLGSSLIHGFWRQFHLAVLGHRSYTSLLL